MDMTHSWRTSLIHLISTLHITRYASNTVLFCSVLYLFKFLHYLQVTGRRDRARSMPFKLDASGPWGFSGLDSGKPRITSKFFAPCYNMNK